MFYYLLYGLFPAFKPSDRQILIFKYVCLVAVLALGLTLIIRGAYLEWKS